LNLAVDPIETRATDLELPELAVRFQTQIRPITKYHW